MKKIIILCLMFALMATTVLANVIVVKGQFEVTEYEACKYIDCVNRTVAQYNVTVPEITMEKETLFRKVFNMLKVWFSG